MELSSQNDAVYRRALRLQQRATESSVDPGILEASLNELRFVLEELQASQEELHLQNQALIAAQQTVEQERQRYRTLYELAPDGYLVTDRQGNICQANQAAANLFSMPQEWLIDKPLAVLIHETDRSRFLTRLVNLEQLQDWEISLNARNGARRSVAISMAQLEMEGETKGMLLCLLRDIAPRKQAEEKIREQAALIDISPDAIMVRDLDCHILFWNKGAEQIYGWTAAEALGKSSCELLFDKFSLQLETALQNVLEKGEWQGEFQKVAKSGQEIWIGSRWKLLRDETGQPHAILAVETDITEQKQLEAQFLRAQRLESLGVLASGIAHDMNNILAPMLASAQLLPVLNPTLDEPSQQLLAIFEDNTRRGTELVKQILAFARGLEGDRMAVQVKHILAELLQTIGSTFPRSIEIVRTFPKEDLWLVSADATQLHQVFMNFCVNARDAMPKGGTLSISVENRVIDETYTRMNLDAKIGAYVAIAFEDTGTGIAPEHIDRIFDPFFTTKAIGEGTGLGLSTVMGIVKNHGGFVTVSSKVDKGTQFQIFLPAAEATETLSEETQESFQGQGELILVVDDEANIRQTLKLTLETQNYKVILAADGIEAIAAYATHQEAIKVVLVDMMMPSMGGSTAIRTLQQFNPQVKVIACSGMPASDSLPETIEVKAFLPKPFTADTLLRTLHKVLRDN
jgi:two-component system, cell cycle sensor histidine kinase and response regulator CckA